MTFFNDHAYMRGASESQITTAMAALLNGIDPEDTYGLPYVAESYNADGELHGRWVLGDFYHLCFAIDEVKTIMKDMVHIPKIKLYVVRLDGEHLAALFERRDYIAPLNDGRDLVGA